MLVSLLSIARERLIHTFIKQKHITLTGRVANQLTL